MTTQQANTTANDTTIKEISLNKTRTDKTFNLKSIGNSKVKHETLLYNLNRIINTNDISFIDYTQGGTKANEPLQPLNTLFSDNIVVFMPLNDDLIKDIEKIKEKMKNENKNKPNKEGDEEGETPNKQLVKIAQELLPTMTATIKRVFNDLSLDVSKRDIKPTYIKSSVGFVHKPSSFVQLLKVNLSNCDVDNIFGLLEDKEKLSYMAKNNIFIHDIDYTRDYKGVFNKEQVIKHLIDEHGFKEEGDENPDNEPVIINNSHLVSNNCLSFIRSSSIGTIRYKFYNKFIQSMESPSVRSKIGSHVHEWVNNPEPILKNAIEHSLNTGLLRLEFTIYVYDTICELTKDNIIREMSYLEQLMHPKLITYNSIETQFKLLCDSIHYNVVIVDEAKGLAFIALYHNKLTGKVNGFYIDKVNSTRLSNAVRWFCTNKPIVVVLVEFDDATKTVNIQQDTYIRMSANNKQLYTYINKGTEHLKTVRTENLTNPQDMGLIANDTIAYKYSITTLSLAKSANNADIVFKPITMYLLTYPDDNTTIRTVNRELRELVDEKEFKKYNDNKLKLIEEKNQELENKLNEERDKQLILHKLTRAFKESRAFSKKFLDLPNGTIIYVFAFREVNTKYGDSFLLACSGDEKISSASSIYIYWSPSNITAYINKVLSNGRFKQLDIKGLVVYGSVSGCSLFKLCKEGTFMNASKHLSANVKIINCTTNNKENVKVTVNDYLIKKIEANIKQCRKIDEFAKTGDLVKVIGYKTLKASMIVRCTINDETEAKDYVASYWLKQVLINYLKNNTKHLNLIVGTFKTTPQKQKALLYIEG